MLNNQFLFFMTPYLSHQVTTASNFINTDTSTSCKLDLPVLFACAIHFLANIFFFTCRNCFSFRKSYLHYLCENITLIYKSELYSNAQFLLFSLSKIRFEMQMRLWWLTSYSYLIRRSLFLHILGVKIRTRAVKYSCFMSVLISAGNTFIPCHPLLEYYQIIHTNVSLFFFVFSNVCYPFCLNKRCVSNSVSVLVVNISCCGSENRRQ
jgi:hypothetical protein